MHRVSAEILFHNIRQLNCDILRITDGPSSYIAEAKAVDLGLDVIGACK